MRGLLEREETEVRLLALRLMEVRKAYAEALFDFDEVKAVARKQIERENGELLGEYMKQSLAVKGDEDDVEDDDEDDENDDPLPPHRHSNQSDRKGHCTSNSPAPTAPSVQIVVADLHASPRRPGREPALIARTARVGSARAELPRPGGSGRF